MLRWMVGTLRRGFILKAGRQQHTKKCSCMDCSNQRLRVRFHCWRMLQPNKILSVAMLIPMKVKQDAINSSSSLSPPSPPQILGECVQVDGEALLSRCSSILCLQYFSNLFYSFILDIKDVDGFVLNICLLLSCFVLMLIFFYYII